MTTIDLYEPLAATERRQPAVLAGLQRLWASMAARRQRRLAAIELSRMDARLLRDMGIEPLDVTDALGGMRNRSVWLNPMRRPDHE